MDVKELICAECGKPVPFEEEMILGEVMFHQRCADKWCEQFINEISSKEDIDLAPFV